MQQILKMCMTTNFPDSITTKPMSNHSNNPSSSNFLLWRVFTGGNWAILDVQNLMRWPTDMRIVGIYQQFSGLCEREADHVLREFCSCGSLEEHRETKLHAMLILDSTAE
jgi:hypothetical protein